MGVFWRRQLMVQHSDLQYLPIVQRTPLQPMQTDFAHHTCLWSNQPQTLHACQRAQRALEARRQHFSGAWRMMLSKPVLAVDTACRSVAKVALWLFLLPTAVTTSARSTLALCFAWHYNPASKVALLVAVLHQLMHEFQVPVLVLA